MSAYIVYATKVRLCNQSQYALNLCAPVLQVCELEQGYGTLATCGWCQRAVHLHCNQPVLKTKPEAPWHCSGCEPIVRRCNAARALLARRALRGMNGAAAGKLPSPKRLGGKSQGASTSRGATGPAKVKVCGQDFWCYTTKRVVGLSIDDTPQSSHAFVYI